MKMMMVLALTVILAATACCAQAENLSVTFYDVGKADAMLITTPAGERILIDAATNKQGKKLVERFEKEGIDAIDVMIITHYDKDHVGGADQILENIAVGTVIMPVYDKESKQHTQFEEALAETKGVDVYRMGIGEETARDILRELARPGRDIRDDLPKPVLRTERVVAYECIAAVILWQVFKAVYLERVVEIVHEGADEIKAILVAECAQSLVDLVLMDNFL